MFQTNYIYTKLQKNISRIPVKLEMFIVYIIHVPITICETFLRIKNLNTSQKFLKSMKFDIDNLVYTIA